MFSMFQFDASIFLFFQTRSGITSDHRRQKSEQIPHKRQLRDYKMKYKF